MRWFFWATKTRLNWWIRKYNFKLKVSFSGPMVHNMFSLYLKLAKKHSGYQSYLGLDTKNLFLLHVNRTVQSLRLACPFTQPDQHHCHLFSVKLNSFTYHMQNSSSLASLGSYYQAGWFESYLVRNTKDRFSLVHLVLWLLYSPDDKMELYQGCGITMPYFSNLVPFHSEQVSIYLSWDKFKESYYVKILYLVFDNCCGCEKPCGFWWAGFFRQINIFNDIFFVFKRVYTCIYTAQNI